MLGYAKVLRKIIGSCQANKILKGASMRKIFLFVFSLLFLCSGAILPAYGWWHQVDDICPVYPSKEWCESDCKCTCIESHGVAPACYNGGLKGADLLAMGKKNSGSENSSDDSSSGSKSDNDSDPAQSMSDYVKDSSQSTTPADVFIPGSTEPIRQDDDDDRK